MDFIGKTISKTSLNFFTEAGEVFVYTTDNHRIHIKYNEVCVINKTCASHYDEELLAGAVIQDITHKTEQADFSHTTVTVHTDKGDVEFLFSSTAPPEHPVGITCECLIQALQHADREAEMKVILLSQARKDMNRLRADLATANKVIETTMSNLKSYKDGN